MTDEDRHALDNWRSRAKIHWSARDLAMVGVAGLVGATAVWFDSAIDQQITDGFKGLAESKRVRRWESGGKRLPIDFMGKGFGGRAHRVKSSGHDLLRLFTTLRQVMDSQFEGARWESGQRIPVQESGQFADVEGVVDAAMRIMQHLAADSSHHEPADTRNVMALQQPQRSNQRLRTPRLLRPTPRTRLGSPQRHPRPRTDHNPDRRDIRTHTATETYRSDSAPDQTRPQLERKRTELLLAAHALVGAISTRKAVAQLLAVKNERGAFHPAAIRHVQVPSLLRAGQLAIDVVDQARRASGYEARTWDELVIDTTFAQNLDLSAQLERHAEMDAAD